MEMSAPHIIEGTVEVDPLTGACTIRTSNGWGEPYSADPQAILRQYKGRDVRFVLVELATLRQMQEAAAAFESAGSPVTVVDGESNQE